MGGGWLCIGGEFKFFDNFSVKFPTLETEERFKCDQTPLLMQKKKKHTDL